MTNISDTTIYSIIANHEAQHPEKTAILGTTRSSLTYKGLRDQIDYIHSILTNEGIKPNDPVTVVLPNGPEMAVTFLGVASAATCAPLNPNYKTREYTFFLQDLKPKALIIQANTQNPVIEVAETLGIKILLINPSETIAGKFIFESIEEKSVQTPKTYPTVNDKALILHTSGTTSRPKMVPLTHRNLCTSARNISETLNLTPDDICLNVMPLFHIHGLIGALLSTIYTGATIICTPNFQTTEFYGWLQNLKPTWYSAVPTIHQTVLDRSKTNQSIAENSSLRFIRSSSSALPPQVMQGLEDTFGVPVIESYGMTEASHQMASNRLPPGKRKGKSVGLPSGPEMAIMDQHGNLLPQGEHGEIVIKGLNVTKGYLNNLEANMNSFTDGWFRTGDEGYFDEEGYLFLTDRIKEIINRGGEKISPREIDEVIMDYPGVKQVVTFAVPDPRLGEEIGVAIVKEENSALTDWDIQKHVSRKLIDFKVPRHILFLEEIPKGATGKLQRIGLADRLAVKPLDEYKDLESTEYKAPSTELEGQLVEIWSDALQVNLGIGDNYFQLGGDSLKAEEIITRISKLLDIKQLPLVVFLQAPTIEEMAKLLTEETTGGAPTLICIQPNGSKTPIYLIHACAGEVLFFADLARNLGEEHPIYAFRTPGLEDGIISYSSVEDLAEKYTNLLLKSQSESNYVIGGAGIGGLIGLEMSHLLEKHGKTVSPLIFFDTIPPFQGVRVPQKGLAQKIRHYMGRINLHRENGHLTRMIIETIQLLYRNNFRQNEPAVKIHIHNEGIAAKYFVEEYDGDILLFMSEKRMAYPKDPHFRIDKWKDLLRGSVETYIIPGEHLNIIKEPYVRQVSSIIKQKL